MRICDRCKKEACIETWEEKRHGKQVDLCDPCASAFVEFLANKPPMKDKVVDHIDKWKKKK